MTQPLGHGNFAATASRTEVDVSTTIVIRREGKMLYWASLFIGLALVALAITYFVQRRDYVYDFREKYNLWVSTKDLTVSTPTGISIALSVSKSDREVAWKIYTQLETRIAAVDFNEQFDSFFLVNQSLHSLFGLVREQISSIPVERIKRDKNDEMVRFYMSILNEGIRPYLSKWHMPISNWIETQQKAYPDKTYFELEQSFPKRKEILVDIRSMNTRMQAAADGLLKIVKAK